jgi:hypothetical protein
MDGAQRSQVLEAIFKWMADRKHDVVYSSVVRETYHQNFALHNIPDELNTLWRFLGFHLVLSVQRAYQGKKKNKGNTLFVFDQEHKEQMRFTDVLMRPPDWSDEYYSRNNKQEQLDQVVDVPYFGDSQDVSLIQLADVCSFFLRRYAEIKSGAVPEKYAGEEEKVSHWMEIFASRSIGHPFIYPKKGRSTSEDLFFQNAPAAIRELL